MYHKVPYIFMYHRDQACLLYVYLILYVYVNMLIFKYTYTYFEKPVLSCRSFFADCPRQCDQANKQCCSNHGTLTWIWDVGSQWLEKRSRHPCWRAWWLVACLLFFFHLTLTSKGLIQRLTHESVIPTKINTKNQNSFPYIPPSSWKLATLMWNNGTASQTKSGP